ncbi:acyl-CoA synthetase family member 2 [Tropilaelaps mercedesae]|uniref:Medium-chain acyl-CoA ligase ACSF2, mitochondrial n=1 Tax=Tropilaelaps mercedesae TaxID=418985 RepID=A0A1V9XLJ6_9ACAR|nr:acyl-CoA synthetase family member 2 [Tropilaelaps mercedesae]
MRSFLRSAIKPQRPIGQVVCPPQLKQPVCSCIQSSDSWQPAPTLSTTAIKEQTAMRSISTAAQHKRGYISTLNVSEAFDKAASENAQKPVCVFNDGLSRTFSEFHQDVAAFAGGLQQLNLSKHARIAIFAPTCYEWLVAKYAINRAGCVVVAMNSTAPKEETGHVLEKTETEAVIIGETFKYVDCYQIICDIFPELKSSGVLNAKRKLKHVISTTVERKPGTITLRELQSAGPTSATRMKLDDPAVIMQSSGSTGKPKSIVLSNGNVVSAAYQNFTAMRLRHSNVVMACLPLYHSFGYLCIEANNTLNGLTTVYTSTKPKPAEILEMMERQRVTTVHGTPTTFFDILNCSSFGRRDLSTVQNGTIGATTLHASVIQNVIEKLRLKDLMLGYGLTETSGACSFADGTNFRGYKPFPGTEFRIAKSAEEMTLDDQQARGEIQIRGATLFLEYLNDDVKTRATFTDDGWFRTKRCCSTLPLPRPMSQECPMSDSVKKSVRG